MQSKIFLTLISYILIMLMWKKDTLKIVKYLQYTYHAAIYVCINYCTVINSSDFIWFLTVMQVNWLLLFN